MSRKLTEDDFHDRYIPEPNTGCWLWTGPNASRYGFFPYAGEKYAHRVSYMLENGPIPDGMQVCHSCDMPFCVNPDHLWLGTQKDNMIDMHSKGRHGFGPNGEAARHSKLIESDVRAIRSTQDPAPKLAKEYGVTRGTINKIRRRATWRHM